MAEESPWIIWLTQLLCVGELPGATERSDANGRRRRKDAEAGSVDGEGGQEGTLVVVKSNEH
jgi:hypothetical protein